MQELRTALPSVIVENSQDEDGKVQVSVAPIAIKHLEDGGVDVIAYDIDRIESEDMKMQLNHQVLTALLSGVISSIINIEEMTGKPGKTMGHAIDWLNTMYIDPKTQIKDDDISRLDKED